MRRAARQRGPGRGAARGRSDQDRQPDRPPRGTLKTALIESLRLIAGWWPRFGIWLARVLAWLSRPLGRGIPEERLAETFPQLPAAALPAVRRETWRNVLQNEALEAALSRSGSRPRYPRVALDRPVTELSPP